MEEGGRCIRGWQVRCGELQEAPRAQRGLPEELPGGGEAGLRHTRIRMDGAWGLALDEAGRHDIMPY